MEKVSAVSAFLRTQLQISLIFFLYHSISLFNTSWQPRLHNVRAQWIPFQLLTSRSLNTHFSGFALARQDETLRWISDSLCYRR